MNALRLLFCCAALNIVGCAVDEPVDDGKWVVGEEDVAVRLERIASHHEEVMSSLRDEDGMLTSDLGPVELLEGSEAAAAKAGLGDGEQDARWVCWDDAGYRSCCTGNWCCFWDGSQWYCG